jgi:hypothetical protein
VDPVDIANPVATRRFHWTDKAGKAHVVECVLGKPEPHDDSGDMCCPYQINSKSVRYAVGIDGIQAFLLALQMVKAELEVLQSELSTRLSWHGGNPGELGL